MRVIIAENERLRARLANVPEAQPLSADHTGTYVGAVVGLSVASFIAIIAVFAIRPDHDNTGLITSIVGIFMAVCVPLIAAAIREVHLSLNGRLSQLVVASRAEGQIAEQTAAAEKKS